MILAAHVLAGAVVASKIKQPWLGLPLAFLSHFLLDMLPHREYSVSDIARPKSILRLRSGSTSSNLSLGAEGLSSSNGSKKISRSAAKILIDFSLGTAAVFLSAPAGAGFFYLGSAVVLATLPDFLLFLSWLKPPAEKPGNILSSLLLKLARFHHAVHLKPKPPSSFGWGFQIAFSITLLLFLLMNK